MGDWPSPLMVIFLFFFILHWFDFYEASMQPVNYAEIIKTSTLIIQLEKL